MNSIRFTIHWYHDNVEKKKDWYFIFSLLLLFFIVNGTEKKKRKKHMEKCSKWLMSIAKISILGSMIEKKPIDWNEYIHGYN